MLPLRGLHAEYEGDTMTIEIRELVIKATVVPSAAAPVQMAELEQIRKTLLDECIKSVLELIEQADQR